MRPSSVLFSAWVVVSLIFAGLIALEAPFPFLVLMGCVMYALVRAYHFAIEQEWEKIKKDEQTK